MRDWSPEQRKAVERKLLEMVAEVGDHQLEHWQLGSRALHYRRPLTVAEGLRLPPPVKMTPDFIRRANARIAALEALGIVRDADVVQTERVSEWPT